VAGIPTAGSALSQFVAIDGSARSACHVVKDAALDKLFFARVAEEDQRCTIIIAARIARDFPSLREQLVDRQRCLRCAKLNAATGGVAMMLAPYPWNILLLTFPAVRRQ
jgi:hypothetical protein